MTQSTSSSGVPWGAGRLMWLLLGLAAFGGSPAWGQETRSSRAADSFVDSIGVNVHLGYTDTIYRRYDDIIRPRLVELGVRHVRDGLRADRKDVIARLNDLGGRGIRSLLLVRPEEAVEIARAASASAWGVEGQNEPDAKGEGWVESARRQQMALYRVIKGDPATARLPVVVSGMANTRDSPGRLGPLAEALDYGNTHSYPGGLSPVSGGWGISLERAFAEARKVCGDRPLIATETGYHNRLRERGHPGVPEAVVAKYLPRLLLIYFDAGIARTYLYEFADEKPDPDFADKEQHFGVLRVDGTPKPAFVALRDLIALLGDPGPSFEPGRLAYALEGDVRDVRRVLLARRDGSFDLIVWQEVPGFDRSKGTEIEVAPRALSLRLGVSGERVECFRPIRSTGTIARFESVSVVPLQVPDDPLVVRISPASSGRRGPGP